MTSKTGLEFKVGDAVVYPAHGVGKVAAIETQEVAGMSLEVYVVTFDHEKMTLRVPTKKAKTAGLRTLAADDTVTKAITRILRADLGVVDDIGLLPVAADAAEGLYRLVDAAYEKRSIAISSNLHPSGFDELMPKTLATATVDRLLHHAHVCQTSGESVRLTQALAGQGVSPLS